jgi:hypothetical protein
VRFVSDSGDFGILVAPGRSRRFNRFQLIVAGRVIGDSDDCFTYSAFTQLSDRPTLDDQRLRDISSRPDEVLPLLLEDEHLHDSSTMPLAESLDSWVIQGYAHRSVMTIVARPYENGVAAGEILISELDAQEYGQIVETARAYWDKIRG